MAKKPPSSSPLPPPLSPPSRPKSSTKRSSAKSTTRTSSSSSFSALFGGVQKAFALLAGVLVAIFSALERWLLFPPWRLVRRICTPVLKRLARTEFGRMLARLWQELLRRFRALPRPARGAILVAVGFVAWMLSGQIIDSSPSAEAATEASALTSVRVFETVEQDYEVVLTLSGQTRASRRVVLRAETSGRVESVRFPNGAFVEAGDVLVELDVAARPLELAEAMTNLRLKEVSYNAVRSLARGGYRSEQRRLQAESEYNQAQVRVDRIRRDLDNTRPPAPFSSVIADMKVERGDFLSVGAEIAHLIDLDPLKVRVTVSERDVEAVVLGTRVKGVLITGETFSGKIGYVAPTSNNRTRTFEVEITLANRLGRWREGLTAEISLPIAESKAHLLPTALLSLDTSGQVGVKVVDESDVVHFRPLEFLGENEKGVWVRGLDKVNRVISVGAETVSDGVRVRTLVDKRYPRADSKPADSKPADEADQS